MVSGRGSTESRYLGWRKKLVTVGRRAALSSSGGRCGGLELARKCDVCYLAGVLARRISAAHEEQCLLADGGVRELLLLVSEE